MLLDVTGITNLTSNIWELCLSGPFPYQRVQAGQFINILINQGKDHILRRPISIAEVDTNKKSLTMVFRVVGPGTEWLSQRQVGDQLNIIGPLGTGFQLPAKNSKVVVVGGGIGVPPLYQLVKELKQITNDLTIILGFRNQADCFWVERFAKLGQVLVATNDGSFGTKGFVTDLLDTKANYEYLYSCGPRGMLQALKNHCQGINIQGYVSLEERMACGVGACYGCVCSSADRKLHYRICKEGPVFNWEEVAL